MGRYAFSLPRLRCHVFLEPAGLGRLEVRGHVFECLDYFWKAEGRLERVIGTLIRVWSRGVKAGMGWNVGGLSCWWGNGESNKSLARGRDILEGKDIGAGGSRPVVDEVGGGGEGRESIRVVGDGERAVGARGARGIMRGGEVAEGCGIWDTGDACTSSVYWWLSGGREEGEGGAMGGDLGLWFLGFGLLGSARSQSPYWPSVTVPEVASLFWRQQVISECPTRPQ